MSSTHSNPPQPVQIPRTPSERALAELFAEILRVEQVGSADNFFSLGGNSLTAVKLIARVRAELGVRLPLWVVFQCASVSELAAQLDGRLEDFVDLLEKVSREFCGACERQDHGRVVTELLASLPARDGMKLFSTSFNWLSMSAAELSGAPSQAVLSQLDGTLSLSPFPFRFLPRYLNGGGRPGQSDSSEVPATGLQVTQGIALEASLLYSSGSLSPRSMAELAASLLGVLEKAVA